MRYCTTWTAAHLILPSQPQSQPPVGDHWTRNSRASLALNPLVLRSHHRLPVYCCLVKPLRVIQPTDTPGAGLLLCHTRPALMYLLPELRARRALGITANPRREEQLRSTHEVRRCQDGKEAYASTHSHCCDLFPHFMPFASTTEL